MPDVNHRATVKRKMQKVGFEEILEITKDGIRHAGKMKPNKAPELGAIITESMTEAGN